MVGMIVVLVYEGLFASGAIPLREVDVEFGSVRP